MSGDLVTGPAVVVGTAVAVALSATLLLPRVRRFVESGSRWLRTPVALPVGGLGGAGAGALAGSWPELVGLGVLALGLCLLVLTDLATLRLPDLLVGPLYPVLLASLAVAAALTGRWEDWFRALLSAGLLVLLYLALALARPSDLGMGDIKLSGLLGLLLGWLGWSELVLGGLAGFAVGMVVALPLLLLGWAGRRTDIPFGPAMVLGAALGAAFGPALLPALG